jgi:hypothetical protein
VVVVMNVAHYKLKIVESKQSPKFRKGTGEKRAPACVGRPSRFA